MTTTIRPREEAKAYALKWWNISGTTFDELHDYMLYQKEMTTTTWLHLDAVGLVGPSGHLMADAISIFWREE